MSEPQPATPQRFRLRLLAAEVTSPVTSFLGAIGDHCMMLGRVVYWGVSPPYRARQLTDAMAFIGVGSLLIVMLVGLFSGMVTSLQTVNALRLARAETYAGSAVGLGLAVELAPVFTAIMLAARAGAGIATELGSMRITEQIDAMATMAVNPVQYLIVPRVIAGTIVAPLLTIIFFVVGMAGAYLVAVVFMNVDPGVYVAKFQWLVDPIHLVQGVIKSAVFGLAFTLIACVQGYNASGGAKGVGLATTRAVVIGCVTILVLDYFLSDILIVVL